MTLVYTGAGSRETPRPVGATITALAGALAQCGYTVRVGGARGADIDFETGATAQHEELYNVELYLPWPGFCEREAREARLPRPRPGRTEPSAAAYDLAARHHPRWSTLPPKHRALHARNGHELLGADLDAPSRFLVCWTADGADADRPPTPRTRGTGQAIRIAIAYHVPVFNLARPETYDRIQRFLARNP
jgi:hypothetical protein